MTTAESRRTALVTGAAGGIGLAVCRRLAADGWRVVAVVHPSEDAAQLERSGVGRIERSDLADDSSVEALLVRLTTEPRWDAFISVAGFAIPGPLEGIPLAALRRQLDVNALAPMRLTRALLPALRDAAGRLVFVGAGQGRVALPFGRPYGASKAALAALTDALRAELDGSGVHVSLIEPGAIRTGILASSTAAAHEALDSMPPHLAARYRAGVVAVLARSESAFAGARAPEELAALIARVLAAPRPKPRYLFGRDARALALVALLPAVLRARLVGRWGREPG